MEDLVSREEFNKELIQVFERLIQNDLKSFLTFCVNSNNLTPIKDVIANLRVYQFKNDGFKQT